MGQVVAKIPNNRTSHPRMWRMLAQIGMTPAKVSEELGNLPYVLKLGSTKIYSNTAEALDSL